jgi:hypothetical protein
VVQITRHLDAPNTVSLIRAVDPRIVLSRDSLGKRKGFITGPGW